jgi:galactose-3-O-sulfotransferase
MNEPAPPPAGAAAERDAYLRRQLDEALGERNRLLRQRDVALGERNELLRQRDVALGERNEFLRQRDEALGECNELLRQRDIALGERNELLRQRDVALGEQHQLAERLEQWMHRADMAVRRGASRPAAMTCERLLLHLHLAKTGGVTLNDIIVRNLSSGEYLVIEMPPRDESALWTWSNAEVTCALAGMAADAVECIRAVLGHYGPGVQRHLPKPCAVVTILRNPVDRLLSYFYYDVQRGVRSDANLEEFVAQGAELALDNYMTRILSGREELDPRGRSVNLASCRRVTNDDYLAAVGSIDCSMLVGVTERFDETLVVLASMLGWSLSDLVYERRNVTASRPSAGEISPATRETLVDMNMYDQQLATYAATRLCHQIANYPGDFDSDFLLFGRLNAAHRAGASMAELRFMERAALGPRWRRSPRAGGAS